MQRSRMFQLFFPWQDKQKTIQNVSILLGVDFYFCNLSSLFVRLAQFAFSSSVGSFHDKLSQKELTN